MPAWRAWCLSRIDKDHHYISAFQSYFGIVEGKPTNLVFHTIFTIGASLGNELFYLSFLPLLFWFTSGGEVGRSIMVMWVAVYFVGHVLKDVLELPRPDRERVARLEEHYAAEHGLPSTHCMAAVSMPWAIFVGSLETGFVTERYAVLALAAVCVAWTVSMSLSRLYMGVHSLLDMATGLVLGVILFAVFVPTRTRVEAWLHSPLSDHHLLLDPILVCVYVAVALTAIYPVLTSIDFWSESGWANSYGDTVLIAGASISTLVAARVNFLYNVPPLTPSQLPFFPYGILRTALGFALLVATRAVVKAVMINLLALFFKKGVNPKKFYPIEIPTKLLTYFAMGIVSMTGLPLLSRGLGIL